MPDSKSNHRAIRVMLVGRIIRLVNGGFILPRRWWNSILCLLAGEEELSKIIIEFIPGLELHAIKLVK